MKKRIAGIVISFMIIIIFIILVINKNVDTVTVEEKDIKLEYKETIIINIGDRIPIVKDYILNDVKVDGNITWNSDIEINYYASEYEGIFKYDGSDITIKLVVVDKEEPVIENVKDVTIYENEKVDLLKDIKVVDNSKDKVDISIKGEYNTSKKGTYSLIYEAIDASGNKASKEFKLIVKEKVSQATQNNIDTVTTGTKNVGKTKKGYDIKLTNGIYYIKGILIANKSYKLPSNYNPGGLLSEFTIAFTEMKEAAKKDGVTLKIVSGYRSYSSQNTIYNRYVSRDGKKEADTYSARPGHSEHQSGLAADLNLIDASFENTKEGKWLADNCYKYGFVLRYPKGKESYTGYIFEPWHFRYIGDEAVNLYNNGSWISLEEYLGIDSKY